MPKTPVPALTYSRATHQNFEETIVFTHHFGGSHATTKRHQDFVNDLGFDCVSFDLNCAKIPVYKTFFQVWREEIHGVLNAVPGNKIIFSFSSPSAASLATIIDGNRKDVRAWITDGGPFFDTFNCLENFYRFITPVAPWKLELMTAAAFVKIGGIGYKSRVRRQFESWPADIPILSIRTGNDRLVPIPAIDKFFAAGQNLPLQTFEITEAQHLEGLKNFPDLYKHAVKEFLLKHARAIYA